MSWIAVASVFFLTLTNVRCQTWAGNYTADSACSSTACCCLGPNLVLTRPSDTVIAFQAGLYGQCLGQSSYGGQSTYPTGYSISVSISVISLTFTLSSDSNRITITNSMGASCGVVATRTIPLTTTTAAPGQSTSPNSVTTTRSTAAAHTHLNPLAYLSMILMFLFITTIKTF